MKARFLLVLGGVAVAMLLLPVLGAAAFSFFSTTIAALGEVRLTDEVTIEEIEVDDLETVKLKLLSNVNTVADATYTASLIVDGSTIASDTTSWTQGEIDTPTRKTLIFGSLSLSGVSRIKAEVTR